MNSRTTNRRERKRNRKIRKIIRQGLDATGKHFGTCQAIHDAITNYTNIHEQILVDIIDTKLLKMNGERLLEKMNSDDYGGDGEKRMMFIRWQWIQRDIEELTIEQPKCRFYGEPVLVSDPEETSKRKQIYAKVPNIPRD